MSCSEPGCCKDEPVKKDKPAFPGQNSFPLNPESHFPGMTLRQWYAGMALQGILSNSNSKIARMTFVGDYSLVSVWAFDYADAMLSEDAHPEQEKK